MPGLAASRWAKPSSASALRLSTSLPPSSRSTSLTADSIITTTTAIAAAGGSITSNSNGNANGNADTNTNGAGNPALLLPPRDELARYARIVRRLKWKLPFLAAAYREATAAPPPPPPFSPRLDGNGLEKDNSTSAPLPKPRREWADAEDDEAEEERAAAAAVEAARRRRTEAELMFKLDFFEYYMLLERALVHLLGVFGIVVSRGWTGGRRIGRPGFGAKGTGEDDGGEKAGNHRYHANVLEALDTPANPLHVVLGLGDVRRQLARAKDLRNRWKTAADDDEEAPGSNAGAAQAPPSLESYDLENILSTIFDGFDAAFIVAERAVADPSAAEQASAGQGASSKPGHRRGGSSMDWTGAEVGDSDSDKREEEQWEFMVEAMDWEAV